MHVIATAGHVDHGKSALLRALTGMEPDRWEEERRRGLTIDLGFVWTDGERGPIAFVDVPGHERFVGNMLAGVGPVPAVLFVVAADEGWMPQSAEHLMALHALGVAHGVLAVTKTDLMEPELAAEEALERIRSTTLGQIPWVGVSARTGAGVPELRRALDDLVDRLPSSDPAAAVRLWVDRSFIIRGAGLVVTGTLAAGTIRAGDTLELARTEARFVVREIQTLNHHVDGVAGVARVALNLRGPGRVEIRRGDALMTPDSYRCSAVVDVRTSLCAPADLPREMLMHIGAATVTCHVRPIGEDTARLTLDEALPVRVGDRVVLRHDRGIAGGAVLLDVDPPVLNRRGAGRRRAGELETYLDAPDGMAELRRRGIVREGLLRATGVEPPVSPLAGDWLVAPELVATLREQLAAMVASRVDDASARRFEVEDARKALDLPDVRLVPPLVARDSPSAMERSSRPRPRTPRSGRARRTVQTGGLACAVGDSWSRRRRTLRASAAHAEVAAAARAGRLVRLAPGVVLLPDTLDYAVSVLAGLSQPFHRGRGAGGTGHSRKVVVPLLEYFALHGRTRRDADGQHAVTGR
jgi:selenocysteine-specific elongation factor